MQTNKRYTLVSTESGYAVRRDDGSYAEFVGRRGQLASEEANEARLLLESGERTEADYDWTDAEPAAR